MTSMIHAGSKTLIVVAIASLTTLGFGAVCNDATTPNDGDWAAQKVIKKNTPEAQLMVRAGDIDNLGFGWPSGFDPFSGRSTPFHPYPWTTNPLDAGGTDRIMVVSSYVYGAKAPCGSDGYTAHTSRPGNQVIPITLSYAAQIQGMTISSAALQIFVDDFQAPRFCSSYQVTINGVRISMLEAVINSLLQTGPIGKLITVAIPEEHLDLVRTGKISIKFDDATTGAGDGYAIDFVKLLINPVGFAKTGKITGTVTDAATNAPIARCPVTASGSVAATTDTDGSYTLNAVPAGSVAVQASQAGYEKETKTVDLVVDETETVDFALTYNGCVISAYQEYPAAGANGAIAVETTGAECSWVAMSDVSWIKIVAGDSGAGSGTVKFTVLPNKTGKKRKGNVVAAEKTFGIIQAAE
jgi:hypothetical protein